MRCTACVVLALLATLQIAGCPFVEIPTTPVATFNTSMGVIVVELDDANAPISVANFRQYVEDGFYDNTLFHRVVKDFVIQGGEFGVGYAIKQVSDPIANESDNGLKNVRGTIGMAREAASDSATSQFYFNVVDNPDLDAVGGLPGYAVFGHVTEGLDVVDAIAAVPTEEKLGLKDVPVEDVIVESVTIEDVSTRKIQISDTGVLYLENAGYQIKSTLRDFLVQIAGYIVIPP
jgi:cyclophilin family peptidyl-prolyl cis-trans isomerase